MDPVLHSSFRSLENCHTEPYNVMDEKTMRTKSTHRHSKHRLPVVIITTDVPQNNASLGNANMQNETSLCIPYRNGESTTNVGTATDRDEDIDKLKLLTNKLNLATRRPSTQIWREKHMLNNAGNNVNIKPRFQTVPEERMLPSDSTWSQEKKEEIDNALAKIRDDLVDMRQQDTALARTLLSLRKDIQVMKLQMSTAAHRQVLNDAMDIEEERGKLSQHCDTPTEQFSSELKQCGVTRMNITTRRFSVF